MTDRLTKLIVNIVIVLAVAYVVWAILWVFVINH